MIVTPKFPVRLYINNKTLIKKPTKEFHIIIIPFILQRLV